MAIKLHNDKPVDLPATVKAAVARRWSSLEAQTLGKIKNEEGLKKAGDIMHRSHKEQV